MKNLIRIVLIFVFYVLITFDASAGIPVLIKGKVLDEFTNKPVDVSMTIKTSDGKKIKIVPNSTTGEYQQVVNSGENYEITFFNFDVAREIQNINVENADKYTEFKFDFKVKKLADGLEVFSKNIFEPNSAELSSEGKKFLEELQTVLKFNRGAKFTLYLNKHGVTDKKTIDAVQKSRHTFLANTISSWKAVSGRIKVEMSSQENASDIKIKVDEIKDPLK